MKSRLLLAALAATVFAAAPVASAQTKLQLSTGVDFSSGKFGGASRTDVTVVPFAARVTTGNWAFRASLPVVSVRGDATTIGQQVFVVVDDNGGLRGGSSGGSGRNKPEDSLTSNSSPGGSGSGGSGSGGSGSTPGGSGSSSGGSSTGSTGGATVVTPVASTRRVTNTGVGDLSLSASYSFDGLLGKDTYVDLTGRVRLPTGDEDKGLSLGVTDYAAIGEVGYDGAGHGVYLSGGRRFLSNAKSFKRVDGWQAGLGGWAKPSDNTTVGAYVDWRESSSGAGDDPAEVGAYWTYKVSKAWKVGLNASAGLTDASPDYGVGVTLSWRANERGNRK